MTVAYLSRILINPLRQSARGYFANPHVVHAAVLGGLVRQPVDERVLWRLGERRLDTGARVQGELLVLTRSRPSFEHIVDEAGYPRTDDGEPAIRDYQPVLDMISTGREFAFRACVNPVYSIRQAPTGHVDELSGPDMPRKRGKRVAHRTVAQQTLWFLGRTQPRWGFVVPASSAAVQVSDAAAVESVSTESSDLRLIDRRLWDFRKGKDKVSQRVRLQTATFEGRLQVTDTELFRQALLEGIGPAKGYGCGLLTVASLRHAEA